MYKFRKKEHLKCEVNKFSKCKISIHSTLSKNKKTDYLSHSTIVVQLDYNTTLFFMYKFFASYVAQMCCKGDCATRSRGMHVSFSLNDRRL